MSHLERECIEFEWVERTSAIEVMTRQAYLHQGNVVLQSTWRYSISTDGVINIEVLVDIANGIPPLPRVGMELRLKAQDDLSVSWFGRGPHGKLSRQKRVGHTLGDTNYLL